MVAIMAADTEAWTEGLAASLAEIKRLTKEISNVWIYSYNKDVDICIYI